VGEHPDASRYDPDLLLHNILRVLARDGCEIVITAETSRQGLKAAADLLIAFGITPVRDEQ
jgi:hypothetical protein